MRNTQYLAIIYCIARMAAYFDRNFNGHKRYGQFYNIKN